MFKSGTKQATWNSENISESTESFLENHLEANMEHNCCYIPNNFLLLDPPIVFVLIF